jgi:mRNA-degrading endonuclease RelE of RelBE toxin-antitoxin system
VALEIKLTGTPFKYLKALDKPTRERIEAKLKAISENPTDTRLSYPLEASTKKASRVGKYRILFTVDDKILTVADIDSRGQVYRNA